MSEQQYRKHNFRELIHDKHYLIHVSAMTREQLHDKADIAEELAWRDMQIVKLRAELAAVTKERDALLPQPPREGIYPWAVPLESTHRHAEYWISAGRNEPHKGRAVMHVEQAVNSWKNACYSYAEKLATITADRDKLAEQVRMAREQSEITLTGKEIRELAEAVGLSIMQHDYSDELETEMTIIEHPRHGVQDDDGNIQYYAHVAYITEYPEEGTFPLGDAIPKPEAIPPIAAQAVPEGWQLVPKEPTDAQLYAAGDLRAGGMYAFTNEEMYKAMLAAAPKPECAA